MGNDPILSLSQSEVLNLYTMATIESGSAVRNRTASMGALEALTLHRVCRIVLVLGIGNDPISSAYQALANPSQLTEHCLAGPEGLKPPT